MRRLPLLWRVFLSTSAATTLLFGLVAYLVQRHALGTATSMLEDELRSSFGAYRALWRSRAAHLGSVSAIISGMPDVRAAFSTGDAATIQDTASEVWARVSNLDAVFLVTAPDGRVIASLSGTAPAGMRIGVVEHATARFPQQSSGWAYLGDRLYQLVVTPVYVHSGNSDALINVLVAGFRADDAFAGAMKTEAAGAESIIVAGSRPIASTVSAAVARELAAAPVEPGRLEYLSTPNSGTWSVLATGLSGIGGTGNVAELRVLRPFTAQRTIAGLQWQIAAIWALAVLFGLLVTYLFARRLLKPIRILDAAAQEVSRGNYDLRVPLEGDDEMGRLARTFNVMCASIRSGREELIRQERVTTLGRVATSIVHDLRNPLAAIYGGAEMLVDSEGLPPSHTQRLAANIYRASRQVLTLLDDLSAMSRGKPPAPETCRLSDVIEDAWSGVAPQAEASGVRFAIGGDTGVEMPLARTRMERVFTNLFTNAIQAMRGGGQIHVDVRRSGTDITVRVSDTGPGVARSIRETLFQPFTTAGKSNGLGLGLALSRQTVVDHGGDLRLEDSAAGACFRLDLPLRTKDATPLGA